MGHGRCCDPQIRIENEKMRRRDSACKQRIIERVQLIVEKKGREQISGRSVMGEVKTVADRAEG